MKADGKTTASVHAPERREGLLRLAARLFATKGFHNTSMQDIANAATIQKASIYYHFQSKDDILWEILEKTIRDLNGAAVTAISGVLDPRKRLALLLQTHILQVAKNRDTLVVFLHERRALNDEEKLSDYIRWRRGYENLYVEAIKDGQNAGLFAQGDPTVMAYGILGMYNWLVQWWRVEGPRSIEELNETLSGMALRSLEVK